MSKYEENVPQTRTVVLHFAHNIRLAGPNTIEVEFPVNPDGRVFTPEQEEAVKRAMGDTRGSMLLEDVAIDLLRRVVLDGVTA